MIYSVVDNHHSLIGSHISFQKQFTDTMSVVKGFSNDSRPGRTFLATAAKKKQGMKEEIKDECKHNISTT